MQKITMPQLIKKYKGKYIDVYSYPSWDTNEKWEQLFEVRKAYSSIHENTALVSASWFDY